MKSLFGVVCLSVFFTLFAGAQENTRVWTLNDCMEYAVQNSPRTRIQRHTNDNYRQDVIVAMGNMLPSISGSVGAGWGFGRSIDPQTNSYNNTSNFNNSYNLSGSIPLFSGLTSVNSLRYARIMQLRGTEELQRAEDDIALETLQGYADVVYYTEAVRMAEEQLAESRRNLYRTSRQAELGLRSLPDVAQFEAEVASYEYMVIRQRNLQNTALLHLKERMNYPSGEPLEIAPEIPSYGEVYPEKAEQIFADACENLPEARIADYTLRASELSLAVARGSYYPSVSAYGSIGTNYFKNLNSDGSVAPFRDQFKNNTGRSVGISVSIPVFSGFARRTRVNRARSNLKIAEETHHETLRRLEREIEQAVMDVEGYAREWEQTIRRVSATEPLPYPFTYRKGT